jgi:membrane-associated phospholipid phosphatase
MEDYNLNKSFDDDYAFMPSPIRRNHSIDYDRFSGDVDLDDDGFELERQDSLGTECLNDANKELEKCNHLSRWFNFLSFLPVLVQIILYLLVFTFVIKNFVFQKKKGLKENRDLITFILAAFGITTAQQLGGVLKKTFIKWGIKDDNIEEHDWVDRPFTRENYKCGLYPNSCNNLINCNRQDTGVGMPSGHSVTIGFFATYMSLVWMFDFTDRPMWLRILIPVLCCSLALGVLWERRYLDCHDYLQIFSGAVFGSLFASGYWWLTRDLIDNKNPKYNWYKLAPIIFLVLTIWILRRGFSWGKYKR